MSSGMLVPAIVASACLEAPMAFHRGALVYGYFSAHKCSLRLKASILCMSLLACCTSCETNMHKDYIKWSNEWIYGTPPNDLELEQLIGSTVLAAFQWESPSSILQSLTVIGDLVSYNNELIVLRTFDGRDGTCLNDAHWSLLLERGRAFVDQERLGLVFVPRKTLAHLDITSVQPIKECPNRLLKTGLH